MESHVCKEFLSPDFGSFVEADVPRKCAQFQACKRGVCVCVCVTALSEANRDMAACFCKRTGSRSIVDVPTTDMSIEETRNERRTVTFMSIDRYAWHPMERLAQTSPSDGGILSSVIATFVANFRITEMQRWSHPLALMTDLYHRRAHRKTQRRR